MALHSPNRTPIIFRAGASTDKNFIFNSWLKSFRKSPMNRRITGEVYFQGQARTIERLLGRSFVAVACNSDERSQVFGYLVWENPDERVFVFHWIYVKYPYRHLGIAKGLIQMVVDQAAPETKFFASHIPVRGFFEHISKQFPVTYDPTKKE